MKETNWAGNVAYRAARLHRPESLDELRSTLAKASSIHALGSRHSFNDIGDSGTLVSLERLGQTIEIDPERRTVTVGGGISYGMLAQALEREGFALRAMASLPHISVAGAISTATHGSGDACGNLATTVAALELVTSEGDVLHVTRNDADFAGTVVGLGALGIITRVTLDIGPSYLMRQDVFQYLDWEVLFDHFDDVTSSAESVSLFTDYGETVNQVWLKSTVNPDSPGRFRRDLLGASAATRQIHPVETMSPDNVTEQLGVPGPWVDRLPHFRMGFAPASGHEVQAEYMIARRHAVDALKAMRAIAPIMQPLLLISEIRTVAADELWLSTAYGVETVCIHMSWKPDADAVYELLPSIEEALAPFEPRPHWGKMFVATANDLVPRYPRMGDFGQLSKRLDPRGAFRNAYLERVLG